MTVPKQRQKISTFAPFENSQENEDAQILQTQLNESQQSSTSLTGQEKQSISIDEAQKIELGNYVNTMIVNKQKD